MHSKNDVEVEDHSNDMLSNEAILDDVYQKIGSFIPQLDMAYSSFHDTKLNWQRDYVESDDVDISESSTKKKRKYQS